MNPKALVSFGCALMCAVATGLYIDAGMRQLKRSDEWDKVVAEDAEKGLHENTDVPKD